MKRTELFKNKGYWISKIQIDLYNHLFEYMTKNNLNRSQFAKKLKVSKGYISQILNGEFNHRLSTLVELSLAIDKVPELNFTDLSQVIEDVNEGIKSIPWTIKIKKSNIETSKLTDQTAQLESKTDFNTRLTLQNQVIDFS